MERWAKPHSGTQRKEKSINTAHAEIHLVLNILQLLLQFVSSHPQDDLHKNPMQQDTW